MNRRAFLGSLGAAGLVAGYEWDLDRLLWRPKPIVVVPALPWHATVRVHFAGVAPIVFRRVPMDSASKLRVPCEHHDRLMRWVDAEYQADGQMVTKKLVIGSPLPSSNVNSRGDVLDAGNTLTLEINRPREVFA